MRVISRLAETLEFQGEVITFDGSPGKSPQAPSSMGWNGKGWKYGLPLGCYCEH